MKKNNIKFFVFIIIIVILSVLCVLFATDIIKLSNNYKDEDINEVDNNVIDETDNKMEDSLIDIDNLKTNISDLSQAYVKEIKINDTTNELGYEARDFYVKLKLDGKVSLSTMFHGDNYSKNSEKDLNINNVIDIVEFSVADVARKQMVYFLTSSGDVYYYTVGDSINGDYEVKKVNEVSKVKKIFLYNYPAQPNTGGTWAIFAINENNECIELNNESV